MRDDELILLRARVRELESQIDAMNAVDEVREVEMRSLELDVALKAQYISRLERLEAEVVAPKDVHIRNLEAVIADLESRANPDSPKVSARVSPVSRVASLRKRKG